MKNLWLGRHITHSEHAKDLEDMASRHEFLHGLPREAAEQKAYDAYKHQHHVEAAAHHLHGLRAAASMADKDAAQKHTALYQMHLKAAGYNHNLPPSAEIISHVPERPWSGFRNHPSDELLGTKHNR